MSSKSLRTVHMGAGVPMGWPVPGAQWDLTANGTRRIRIRIGHDGYWMVRDAPPLGAPGRPVVRTGQAFDATNARRWAQQALSELGYHAHIPPLPKTARPPKPSRKRGVRLPGAGYYPDLLGPTGDVRGSHCGPGEPKVKRASSRRVKHTTCDDDRFHHFRYLVGGEAVAGLTLKAKRPWRGLQTATIDRVFTAQGHRRQGYASSLLEEAEATFRRVKHSTDLTDVGALWKKAVTGKGR